MLVRTDPFRELERLSQQVFGGPGTVSRPSGMPMDAWREGESFVVEFDLPGIDPSTIDLDVESNVLTVRVERPLLEGDREILAAERPRGVFSRQVILGENLDTTQIEAGYSGGVLTLRIPIAERAKPRKIQINTSDDRKVITA
jgi:HSP20 family protein